jgi:membrane protease YdiL (CAAX protease family)
VAGALHPRWQFLALIGVALVLIVPEIPLPAGGGVGLRLAKEAWWVSLGVAILLWVTLVERRPLSSIGLKPPAVATFGWAAVMFVLLMASVMLSYALILPAMGLSMNQAATAKIVALPGWLQFLMFLRAGVVEEILYRGYPIERIEQLTGSKGVAVLLPGLAFVGAHFFYWGGGQLVVVAFATVILSVFYLWKRDLVSCMIAHAATDMVGFALANSQM